MTGIQLQITGRSYCNYLLYTSVTKEHQFCIIIHLQLTKKLFVSTENNVVSAAQQQVNV